MKRSLRQMGISPPRPFDPKKDRNFESWLNRIEFHFEVTKYPVEDKTGSLLLLLDVECFEVAKHLGLKLTTNFDEAKAKLNDYFAITENSEELRERLDLRCQEAGESIESFAPDIKLIGHRAYPNAADPAMLEHILIKQFVNGLSNKVARACHTQSSQNPQRSSTVCSVCGERSPLHETTQPPRLHQVRCQASASEVAGQAVAPAGSPHVAANSRLHVSAVFEAVAEVAQSDAEH